MQIWHLGRLVQAIFFILPFASSIPLQTVAPQKKVYPDSELLAALALATPDSAPNSFNCSDLNAQHVECWQELDMEGYLNDWNAKKLSQCEGQKAWVNCYLSVEVGWRVSDCTSTDDGKCGSWIVDPSIHDPHVFYTVYNIYSMFSTNAQSYLMTNLYPRRQSILQGLVYCRADSKCNGVGECRKHY